MFASKSQILNGGFDCVDVSGRMYLWTPKGKSPDRLIINAHGIRRTTASFVLRGDAVINFYSHDRNSVRDPGIKRFYEGKTVPVETLRKGDQCFNYILAKYTNSSNNSRHNGEYESYDKIQEIMATDYIKKGMDDLSTVIDMGDKVPAGMRESLRKSAMNSMKLRPASILTIRNRRLRADINLEWGLNALAENGYHFKKIDCLFCRSTLWTSFVDMLSVGASYGDDVIFS
ncbi:hypothetical protein Q2E61_07880 [Microbulbifer thermotolerans]|uniref:putative adhesin n=1 Tax=Microbulbifer thermotolerans TaxID=252514 RepID=UPI0022490F3F|nr:hypothetical protein [Microbulbifer thermotolerans]MCX2795062.1 hypothetical protein [Microbulbifer thermotolerans]WKT62104.1 hypothetical protein Q2E61_07880 [Microbulbifer thermotolerans]